MPIPHRGTGMHLDADVIVVGAGLAGLSVALELTQRSAGSRSVLVIDARPQAADDRIWCRFDIDPHLFPEAEVQRWSAIEYGDRHGLHTRTLDAPYVRICAATLHASAAARLGQFKGTQMRWGVAVEEISGGAERASVHCADSTLSARYVIDTRPKPVASILRQRFEGLRIEVPDDTFDPACATLMDFAEPDSRGAHFMYLLPSSQRSALIEDTWFAPESAALPAAEPAIRQYLAQRFGITEFLIVGNERGDLPMGSLRLGPRQVAERHLALGVGAGDIRDATGYAYTAIGRTARAMATWLLDALNTQRAAPVPPMRAFSRSVGAMDRLFLKALARQPEDAQRWFCALFARVPSPTLERFLHDGGSWRDRARVIGALPARPFLRAAGTPVARCVPHVRRPIE